MQIYKSCKYLRNKLHTSKSWASKAWPKRSEMNDCRSPDVSWRGVSLTEIYGSDTPWGAPEFPLVSPGFKHSVLYHISSNGIHNDERPPKPQIGQDKWDNDFVRLPCSSHSLYPVEQHEGDTSLQKRWQLIENALQRPIENSKQLANVILEYNTKFKTIWKFRALHTLFNDYLEEEESEFFFRVTLPEIAKLALALPNLIQSPIPLLKQHRNRSVSMSQQQIACLLANAFFCTFPRRNTTKRTSEYASYPHINFNVLYESRGSDSVLEKLKCLCHYFRRVTTKVPVGVLTFTRRSVPPKGCPLWETSIHPIVTAPIHVNSSGKIEDEGVGLIQVDFANKYLGGGVLGHGCVQEEIRFVICPELMVSMLFTEVLRPNEALLMIGSERFSNYSGYGHDFRWSGDHKDSTPIDSSGRRRFVVLAIDALPFSSRGQEFKPDAITREINKAWIGFSIFCLEQSLHRPGIASGNWGCGAFGGTPRLKFLLQLMAAAQAKRPLVYYTFGDIELRNSIVNIYHLLVKHNVTVGELYNMIISFAKGSLPKSQLYAFIQQTLVDKENGRGENMDVSSSSEKGETLTTNVTEDKPRLLSPDLFSQESTDSPKSNTRLNSIEEILLEQPNEETSCTNPPKVSRNSTSNKKNLCTEKNNVLTPKKPTKNTPTRQTLNLFEEMTKLDESSGKLNFNQSHRFQSKHVEGMVIDSNSFCDEVKLTIESDNEIQNVADNVQNNAENVQSIAESVQSIAENEQKYNEIAINDVKDELMVPNTSKEVQAKMRKKITDYFSKKT